MAESTQRLQNGTGSVKVEVVPEKMATAVAAAMAARNRTAANLEAIKTALYAGTATSAQQQIAIAALLEVLVATDLP